MAAATATSAAAASSAHEVQLEADGEVDAIVGIAGMVSEGVVVLVPPKRGGGGAGVGGKKRKEKKGNLWCPGCAAHCPAVCFEMNQRFEVKCKRLLDRVYNQARTQGGLDWFKQQKQSDEKVEKMLDHYRNILCSTEDPKLQKFSVAQYKESFKTSQGVEFRGHGEMMWEGRAIEFWCSPQGGSLSPDDARAKWDDWASHCKERAIIFDMASPNPKKPLRLRVPTSDSVDFARSAMHSKEMEKQSAAVKRPKDIDLDMMHARTLVGFDKIGNGSAGVDNMNWRRAWFLQAPVQPSTMLG